ncbi:MAG: glutamate 5-kinase, partial [Solirubrobacterales bacterium]
VNYLNARATLKRLLQWRAVPVINENDTTATDEITFGDNDFLAAQVALLLGARQLVLLTDTAGLHTSDPCLDADAKLVERVDDPSELLGYDIGSRTSPFGSGGMRSKVAAAEMATSAGVEVVVCDGTLADGLSRAVEGENVGTLFPARDGRAPSFKLWLRYAKPARGTVRIDAGAARVLREQGSSLLPVGVVEVRGDFEAGDAIEVVDEGGPVGKGIVNYSAGELGRIKGMKSREVRELMPHAADEVVHRDHFVLS